MMQIANIRFDLLIRLIDLQRDLCHRPLIRCHIRFISAETSTLYIWQLRDERRYHLDDGAAASRLLILEPAAGVRVPGRRRRRGHAPGAYRR